MFAFLQLQTFTGFSLLKQRVARLCLAVAMSIAIASPAALHAQEMEVPVAVQIPLFLKVMTFDRQRMGNGDAEVVVGVTFQNGYRNSISVRDEVVRTLRNVPGKKIRIVLIDLDHDPLVDVLEHQNISILYVSPLRSFGVAAIAAAAASAKVTTVTGVPHHVEQGIAVGVRLQGDRPRLLVNLTASRLGGADFTAELLKLAEVLH